MARGGKMKAKLEQAEEESEAPVILLSSDEEANEDLSLKIVEKARSRAAKRKQQEEDVDEFKASDGFKSVSVINLFSSSDEEVVGDLTAVAAAAASGGGGGGVVEAEAKKKKKKKRRRNSLKPEEEKAVDTVNSDEFVEAVKSVKTEAAGMLKTEELVYTVHAEKKAEPVETEAACMVTTEDLVYTVHTEKVVESVETNAVEKSDNIVLRKLLRGPRYFDPPNSSVITCFNCGEEGHMAVNCTSKKRKKPCFVCGSFEHGIRNCTQGKDCYICKKSGHRAKNCPEKNQRSTLNLEDICLRCGESGHTMFSCTSDYNPEDLKQIQCYVCKKLGHLCCVDPINAGTGEVSCYNCGQLGHSGAGCAKQRGDGKRVETSTSMPTKCYKCGEEGHFARGCTKHDKTVRRLTASATPIEKSKKKAKKSPGFQSVPPDLSKAHKKKHTEYEGKHIATPGRFKPRGGWTTDDPGDLPQRKFQPNVWVSPSTPINMYHRTPNFSPGGRYPNSGSPWNAPNYGYGSPSSSHGSSNYYQQRHSASRFGNYSGGWDGRTYGW